jgi:uncharacterized membrane protein
MPVNVSDSVVIAKPVPEVFAFVADHENLPAWTVGVKQARRVTEGPPASGSRYRMAGKLLGQSIEVTYQITRFDPGRGFDATMSSPVFGFSEQYRFESAGAGTRVSMTATITTQGLFRLIRPVLLAGVRRQVKADHRRLKSVLERPAPIAGPGR